MTPVITLHNQLMGSSNQLQVIGMVELLGNILGRIKLYHHRVFIENKNKQENRAKIPDQMCIQPHEEKFPNHTYHLDQTTTDHTWDLHGELLEHGQNFLCYQGFQ